MRDLNKKLLSVMILLGSLGVLAIIPYELAVFDATELPEEAVELSREVVAVVNSFSQIFLVTVASFIGVLTMKRTRLGAPLLEAFAAGEILPKLSRTWVKRAVGVSVLGSLVILLLDYFVFMPQLVIGDAAAANLSVDWWQRLLIVLYGGITEEILLRFCLMGLIVWLLALIFRKQAGEIPKSFYITAIVLASILFGLGHLPATAQLFGGLNALLISRAILLNGLLGLWFGYLYYRKGLEYAILAHLAADLFLHVLMAPLIG